MEFIGIFFLFAIWLLVLVASIGGFVLWIMAIIELVKMPEPAWGYAQVDKTTWLLVVILLGWLGAIIYWFSVRRRLLAARDDLAARGMLNPLAPGYYPPPQYGYPQPQYGYTQQVPTPPPPAPPSEEG